MAANNMFNITGRLTRDPQVYTNKDGSRKVMMTLAVPNNFKDKDGNRGSQFIGVEQFLSAKVNGLGVYDYVHKGDLVSVAGSIRSSVYEDKATGKTVFTQVLNVEDVTLQESRKTTTERANSRANGQAAAENAPAPAEPAAAEAPVSGPVATGEDDPFGEDAPFGA